MSSVNKNEEEKKLTEDNEIKVLFLDIDGVLNTMPKLPQSNSNQNNNIQSNEQHFFAEIRIKRLKQIIDTTKCKIVLSSSWRKRESAKKLLWEKLQSVNIDYNLYYIGDTPSLNETRSFEIYQYVNNSNEYKIINWCAVDDMDLESHNDKYGKYMKNHFVSLPVYLSVSPLL